MKAEAVVQPWLSPTVEIPSDPELRLAFRRLENKAPVDDVYFDRIFPDWAARLSRIHWTPIPVIRRSVDLLTQTRSDARILDVGSGVGKFCLVGATISQAKFFGVEQRPRFVGLARRLANHYRVPRVTFIQANMNEIDWSDYDGVYLFNPFQEFRTPEQCLDDSIDLDRSYFDLYVRSTTRQLLTLPVGAHVVTYFGFGGTFPPSFTRIAHEHCHRGPLECWVKIRR